MGGAVASEAGVSEEDAHEHWHPNHMGLFLGGLTSISSDNPTVVAIGVSYERRFSELLGLEGVADFGIGDNYRTVKMPSNMDVPEFVQGEFAEFYRAMFDQQVVSENERAVFLEYAWDMNWCDPCAADPLSQQELRKLGVYWVGKQEVSRSAPNQSQDVFVTRLHGLRPGEIGMCILAYHVEPDPGDLSCETPTKPKVLDIILEKGIDAGLQRII